MPSGTISVLSILRHLLLALPWLLIVHQVEAASFQLVYNTPRGEDETNARAFIDDEGITQTVSDLLNDEFQLREDLTLFMGGGERPRFDPSAGEVHMPYDFVYEVARRFNRDAVSPTNADIYDVTRDAYLHALLHNVSHALFRMYDLRTSGDTEKAVDALTVLLLLRYYENGGDIVLNAAALFVDDGGGSSPGADFWSEHRFDRQSYNQALCLAYGSDPDRYAGLRRDNQFLQIRDQECVREYQRQETAWFRVLGSFLKRPPPG